MDKEPAIHNPGTVLLGIAVAAALFQGLLVLWKRKHISSYDAASLILLWILPLLLALRNGFVRFPVVWLIFSIINGYLYRLALARRIIPSTPRLMYMFYRGLFQVTMALAAIGYTLFLANVLLLPSAAAIDWSICLMFYGLYFGVLGRDLIEFTSGRMASTIGYYNKDGLPMKVLRDDTCSICGDTVSSLEPGIDHEEARLRGQVLAGENHLQLNCGHTFHSSCLYGWCMIGKKDTCPYCKERLDLQIFQFNPWKNPEFLFGKLLDAVRYLVAWNPLLFLFLHFVIEVLQR